ncbi:hypothetical protein [Acidiplasma cupricumulans]|uniref:hypothetical protein n=1 Tax=Acidiplasma cupricumulans TaxID=312540 RepID=UPI0007818C0D|nr:hypothetical protein [Acidiplasma cupricumulans]
MLIRPLSDIAYKFLENAVKNANEPRIPSLIAANNNNGNATGPAILYIMVITGISDDINAENECVIIP